MDQEQNNNELKVKYYRETGQATGMIGKITLSCSLGEICLNVFRDEEGIITPSQQSLILANEERKIIEIYGTEKIINIVKEYVSKESTENGI